MSETVAWTDQYPFPGGRVSGRRLVLRAISRRNAVMSDMQDWPDREHLLQERISYAFDAFCTDIAYCLRGRIQKPGSKECDEYLSANGDTVVIVVQRMQSTDGNKNVTTSFRAQFLVPQNVPADA